MDLIVTATTYFQIKETEDGLHDIYKWLKGRKVASVNNFSTKSEAFVRGTDAAVVLLSRISDPERRTLNSINKSSKALRGGPLTLPADWRHELPFCLLLRRAICEVVPQAIPYFYNVRASSLLFMLLEKL